LDAAGQAPNKTDSRLRHWLWVRSPLDVLTVVFIKHMISAEVCQNAQRHIGQINDSSGTPISAGGVAHCEEQAGFVPMMIKRTLVSTIGTLAGIHSRGPPI
jgi:hypothetical protein